MTELAGWNKAQKLGADHKVTLEMLVRASYEGQPASTIEP